MVYTKATFEMVARILKDNHPRQFDEPLREQDLLGNLAVDFAREFARSNDRFDQQRFYRACGLQEDK